jgi:D-3-phosphoglycerate dehydrogenase
MDTFKGLNSDEKDGATMICILAADKLAAAPLERMRAAEGVSVDERVGLSPAELAGIVGNYDGMLIRSGVQITAEVLKNPGKLRAIARAGVGVDNVDLKAATEAGVLVMNTPDANTLSTAEHAIAMMLAAMRRIPSAHGHVAGGGWDRKAYVGEQLAGKTLGIVGLGRVGAAVAKRALAFDMEVLAFDPFLSGDTALDGQVVVVPSLEALLKRVDCLTLHAALTDATRNMIGAKQLAEMKSTAVLINCARGGLVDESALANALKSGHLGAAALDVFASEPPENCPLMDCPNVVMTPHLGASTRQAQLAVSEDAVDAMLDYLLHGTIRSAVNVTGMSSHLSDRDRAQLDLISRLSMILSPVCVSGVDRVVVTTHGEDIATLCPTLAKQAVVDLMSPHISGRLNLVNAEAFAHQRGIEVQHNARSTSRREGEGVQVAIECRGQSHSVEGTVSPQGVPRLLAVDGYRMELVPGGRLVLIFNDDKPGVIGIVGVHFGDAGVNIADMSLSRRDGKALMVLKLDGDVQEQAIQSLIDASPSILSVRSVELPLVRADRHNQ